MLFVGLDSEKKKKRLARTNFNCELTTGRMYLNCDKICVCVGGDFDWIWAYLIPRLHCME